MPYRALLIAAFLGTGGSHPRPATAADEALPPGAVLRLGDTRFRAGGEVTDLLFSADGAELTSRVPNGRLATRVTVWDAATGNPLRVTTQTESTETRIRWGAKTFPDSDRGVDIGPDGVAVVRDFGTGKDLARLTGHFARVTAVTVSPDGTRIATASADGLIRVWDAATFRPLTEPRGHTAAVRGVVVSPDGRLVLTTGADRTVRVWDLATGRELRAFPADGDATATFTPDGIAARIPVGDRVIVRDLVTGLEVVPTGSGRADPFAGPAWLLRQSGSCTAASPDGRTVAAGYRSGVVELYEAATGQVRRRLAGHLGACRELTFTPDGSRLLTAGSDHCVLVWGVRLRDVPLPTELKRETSAARLWDRLARGDADAAYLAMARLAADPAAAVKMARLRMASGTDELLTDVRAVELLEAVGTTEAKALLRELAAGDPGSLRVRAAAGALARMR